MKKKKKYLSILANTIVDKLFSDNDHGFSHIVAKYFEWPQLKCPPHTYMCEKKKKSAWNENEI